ncbi:MAG: bifunctional riboflavin kinase/FAD synthetase [Anaerolineae bacterium]
MTTRIKIYNSLDSVQPTLETVLTVGTFDGVHRGHQALLRALVQRAAETGRSSAVLTFHPHPRLLFQPQSKPLCLSTLDERIAMIEALGVDSLLLLPFTRELADTSARDFAALLHDKMRMRELWVGADFAMGHGREGNVAFLQELGPELGFEVHVVQPLYDGSEPISSTRIRALLARGQVLEAGRLLGRLYTVTGRVIVGAKRGRVLGFRTANIRPDPECSIPGDGVYAVWAIVDGQRRAGVANVGIRPSFDAGERLLEVHLLDYEGDLYGRDLAIQFVQWLRPEKRFEETGALVDQVQRDIAYTRDLLSQQTADE